MNAKLILGLISIILMSCSSSTSPSEDEEADISNGIFSSPSEVEYSSSSMSVSSSSNLATIETNNFVIKILRSPSVIISSLMMMPKIGYKDGLVQVSIQNTSQKSESFITKIEIQGISEEASVTTVIGSGKTENVNLTPIIVKEKYRGINQIQDVSIVITVTVNSETIFSNTISSKITANDVIVWDYNDNGSLINYENTVLGWITPSTSKVESVLAEAKKALPNQAFTGYQTKETNNIYKMYSTIVCCGSDAFGGSPDPFIKISNGSDTYTTPVNNDNGLRIQSWNTSFSFKIAGEYSYSIYDADVSSNDYMTSGNFTVPMSFFENHDSMLSVLNASQDTIFKFYSYWVYYSNIQVEAIYNQLKALKLSYVSSSTVDFGTTNTALIKPGEYTGQKIRFPDSSIATTNYNCIDGVVLFASLMESVGIKPIVVLVPGHSYVGWYVNKEKTIANYLETTLLSSSTYDEANSYALKAFATDKLKNTTKILDVEKLRSEGYMPLN